MNLMTIYRYMLFKSVMYHTVHIDVGLNPSWTNSFFFFSIHKSVVDITEFCIDVFIKFNNNVVIPVVGHRTLPHRGFLKWRC